VTVQILIGDARAKLRELPPGSVHACITSPPYWSLRAYHGGDGMIGMEPDFDQYVSNLVDVFREVRRVLRDDGTLWLNLGDGYHGSWGNYAPTGKGGQRAKATERWERPAYADKTLRPPASYPSDLFKPKDLMMIPSRVAIALQADGWWHRSEIVWCLSGGTHIYAETQRGVGIRKLKDLVSRPPETVRLWNGARWTQVVQWRAAATREGARELVLRSGERIGCTGEHHWPTRNRGLVKADELVIGDVLETTTLPDTEDPVPPWLTDDALWFAGLYLAEGSRSGETIQISGHVSETERVARVCRLAQHYGATVHCHNTGGYAQVICIDRAKAVNAIVDTVIAGRTAKNKRLASVVWTWPNEALKLIVEGYLHGDGSDRGGGRGRYRLGFTRNYDLERDLRTLAARLGCALTLKPSYSMMNGKRFASFKGEWCWKRTGHWNEKDRGEIVAIRRSRARRFYDVTVADEPHLFALASGVLTHNSKDNPTPESIGDRPTCAHEKVLLFAKTARNYYDVDAVRLPSGARLRNVWHFKTSSYKGAHYAVFPTELVERCVRLGTSERGVCAACGTPWVRTGEVARTARESVSDGKYAAAAGGDSHNKNGIPRHRAGSGFDTVPIRQRWRPSCDCGDDAPVASAVVLDPFAGSGTVGVVAHQTDRRAVLVEISPEYAALAERRIADEARSAQLSLPL